MTTTKLNHTQKQNTEDMSKNNKKLNGKDNRQSKIEKLSELKLRHDQLTNELYHLHEYISLVEYDPFYIPNSENYERLLEEKDVTWGSIFQEKKQLHNENSGKKVRRSVRHLRDSGSSTINELDTMSENDINLLKEVDILAKQKLQDLKLQFSNSHIKKKGNTKRAKIVKQVPNHQDKSESPQISERDVKTVVKDLKPNHRGSEIKPEIMESSDVKNEIENCDFNEKQLKLYKDDDIASESDFYFTTSSEDELPNKRRGTIKRRKRINLYVNPPKAVITNPDNIANSHYPTLHEYLDSFKILEDDMTNEEYSTFIKEQQRFAKMIKKGIETGALKYDPVTETVQPSARKVPNMFSHAKVDPIQYMYKEQNLHIHQEHLINQGLFSSKLVQNRKKQRIAGAKKIAQMIEQHFKHIAGAEDRRLKENEKQRKAIARNIIQSVKKRWNLAEKAYRILKKDEEEQLKRIQGKEHLSKMLEKSSKLLGAQLKQHPNEDDIENSTSDDFSSTGDSDNLSSSSDEESDDEINDLSEDQKNNINELKTSSTSAFSSPEISSPSKNPDLGLNSLLTNDFENESNSSDTNEEFIMGDSDTSHSDDENLTDDSEDSNDGEHDTTSDNEKSDLFPADTTNDPLAVQDVPTPSLLRGTLRTYQKQGLNWLASLYNNNTNGILADEMGLGKTIQTISLLSYLACEKHNWGPHLIVVPTSVLLNWEMEFKRFAPGFKVLTYYGNPQQRKEKRKGWNKPDAFHVCIVSYQLIVQDQHSFKRKKWQYMVLDEAHNIKNFRSTRWQALLNFNTQRRILLTGTPLQNNIAELWSLLYFLMPQTVIDGQKVSGFADLDAFQQWFGRPVDKLIETGGTYEQDNETKRTVEKLHQVLRPYLLRRLKADVEKQIPGKYEHIVYCKLSKRQRFLYDDFMSRAQTKATLASGNFMSIVNCLMQLRKVCNHPDLFEVRPIKTSFLFGESVIARYSERANSITRRIHFHDKDTLVDLQNINLQFTNNDLEKTSYHTNTINKLACINEFVEEVQKLRKQNAEEERQKSRHLKINTQNISNFYEEFMQQKLDEQENKINFIGYLNSQRCSRKTVYGMNLIRLLEMPHVSNNCIDDPNYDDLIKPLQTRLLDGRTTIEKFAVLTPGAVTSNIGELTLGMDEFVTPNSKSGIIPYEELVQLDNPFHQVQTKLTIAFPDKSLLQYDCGKLQKLAILLQQLKDGGHRALIFTQMTKVLDILEQFLNYHGYLYMRLDGATKIEDRQILTERFNSDPKITVFILSSRSGGLGINLTGADTVIFYDSDWNPAMDKQCQDRCHRIGQTRDVHIYRFVSEHTIESNILKKANQKRQLDDVIIQKGEFTTDYFSKLSVKDLFGSDVVGDLPVIDTKPLLGSDSEAIKDPKKLEKLLAQAEDEDDVKAANSALREVNVDDEDFDESSTNKTGGNILNGDDIDEDVDEYEGTNHVEEYMLRFIANGFYF